MSQHPAAPSPRTARRTSAALALAALLLAVVGGTAAAPAAAAPEPVGRATAVTVLRDHVVRLHRRADRLHKLVRLRPAPRPRLGGGVRALTREATRWATVARRLRIVQRMPGRRRFPRRWRAWMCIHAGEGPWNANTGNGYYGGLQMDMDFQRTHGLWLLRLKGTADRWTPTEQVAVAERAWRQRGFAPWPTTARRCGLL